MPDEPYIAPCRLCGEPCYVAGDFDELFVVVCGGNWCDYEGSEEVTESAAIAAHNAACKEVADAD